MTFLGLSSIHVFIMINSENISFYSNIVLLKSYIINKLLYYLNVIMVQCYLTIIVLISYLSYLVPQYCLCTIVRYMKCTLLVLTNHHHYFSIISSYTIRFMCSFYYYTSYCIVTVHTFLPPTPPPPLHFWSLIPHTGFQNHILTFTIGRIPIN